MGHVHGKVWWDQALGPTVSAWTVCRNNLLGLIREEDCRAAISALRLAG